MRGTIIWDFDGTLAQRPYLWSGSIKETLDVFLPGNQIPIEDIRPFTQALCPWASHQLDYVHLRSPKDWWSFVNHGLESIYSEFVPSNFPLKQALAMFYSLVLDSSRYLVFPEVEGILKKLSVQWDHVILSNNFPELPEIVSKMPIAAYFSQTFTSAAIGFEKPHPEAYRWVLERLESRDAIWMIGDSEEADAYGAERAGISAILVRHPSSQFPRQAKDLVEAEEKYLCANGVGR